MLSRAQAFASVVSSVLALAAFGCGAAGDVAPEDENHPPPVLGECTGRGCVDFTQAVPQATPSSGRGSSALPGAAYGPSPSPRAASLPGGEPVPLGSTHYAPTVPVPGSTPVPAETVLGGGTGLGASGPLANPNTTGPGYGAIPPGGPGPGVGPGYNGRAATIQPGPVCPGTQPTTGSPCDPVANSFACTYGQTTCMCSMTWNCF